MGGEKKILSSPNDIDILATGTRAAGERAGRELVGKEEGRTRVPHGGEDDARGGDEQREPVDEGHRLPLRRGHEVDVGSRQVPHGRA